MPSSLVERSTAQRVVHRRPSLDRETTHEHDADHEEHHARGRGDDALACDVGHEEGGHLRADRADDDHRHRDGERAARHERQRRDHERRDTPERDHEQQRAPDGATERREQDDAPTGRSKRCTPP